jgi:hypothetical protein
MVRMVHHTARIQARHTHLCESTDANANYHFVDSNRFQIEIRETNSAASLGLTACSHVDVLGVRYKSVNFEGVSRKEEFVS